MIAGPEPAAIWLRWRSRRYSSQADKVHVKQAKKLLTSVLVAQPDLDARGAAWWSSHDRLETLDAVDDKVNNRGSIL
jgi:hypothetical protein